MYNKLFTQNQLLESRHLFGGTIFLWNIHAFVSHLKLVYEKSHARACCKYHFLAADSTKNKDKTCPATTATY